MIPSRITVSVSSIPSRSEAAAPGWSRSSSSAQRGELLERDVVVGLLPRLAEPALDRVAVALGEVVEHVSLLVL